MAHQQGERSRAWADLMNQSPGDAMTRRTIARLAATAMLSVAAVARFDADGDAKKKKKRKPRKPRKSKPGNICGRVSANGSCEICDGSCANLFPLCNHVQGCICVKTETGTGCVATSGGYCAAGADCASCATGDICMLESCGTCPGAKSCWPPCS